MSRLLAAITPTKDAEAKKLIASLEQAVRSPDTVAVTDRLVKSAYSVLSAKACIRFSPEKIPAPFPSPHTLAWYFGTMPCHDEIRVLATSLKAHNTRVWSVAHGSSPVDKVTVIEDIQLSDSVSAFVTRRAANRRVPSGVDTSMTVLPDGMTQDWAILVQVLGASTDEEAVRAVEIETRKRRQRLKAHALVEIRAVDMAPYSEALTGLLEKKASVLFKREGMGRWVEVSLVRRDP